MAEPEKLEPLRLGGTEAYQSGPRAYAVHDIATGRNLGDIRVGDDGRFEATGRGGKFAGVHKTLAEAVQALTDH